jgi:hypothetical protein
MSGQEKADRSYVFVTDKMVLFCDAATRFVKMLITPVTRLYKEKKMSSLYTKQSTTPS